jgi:hypothetical protein
MIDYLEKLQQVAALLDEWETLPRACTAANIPVDHHVVYLIAHAAGCTDDDNPALFLLRLGTEESKQAVKLAITKQRGASRGATK